MRPRLLVALMVLVVACRGRSARDERFSAAMRDLTASSVAQRSGAADDLLTVCCGPFREDDDHDQTACHVATWLFEHTMDPAVLQGASPRLGELCTQRIPAEAVMSALARLPASETEAREQVVNFLAQYEQTGSTVRAIVEAVRASPELRVPYRTLADNGDDVFALVATYLFDPAPRVRELAIFALDYALEHPLDLPQLEGMLEVAARAEGVFGHHARGTLARHRQWATRPRGEAIDALLAAPTARIGRRRIGCGEVRVRQWLELDAIYASKTWDRDAARRALARRATYCPYE